MSNYPFDLDKALAAWRRSLEYNRTFTADDLDELEQHLRDQVAGFVAQGLNEKAAFAQAMREMGDYGTAESEYRKVYWGKLRHRGEVLRELMWRFSMLKNYFKIAFRNLRRQKGYSFINIAGLMLGLTCCLLIFQFVAFEYSFDDFNEHAATIYRVTETSARNNGDSNTIAMSPYAMGGALEEAVPEVVRYARIHPDYANPVISNPEQRDKAFEETDALYVDASFLQMFSYPLVAGENALDEPGTMLLSESAARRYFGEQNPIGRTLKVNGWMSDSYQITGVLKDAPVNSHLQFDFLMPVGPLVQSGYSPDHAWRLRNFMTYVQLRPDARLDEVERKFTDAWLANVGEVYREGNIVAHLNAQPLRDLHLNNEVMVGALSTGSYRTVYFFTLLGVVLFLIALINYVNLATARALDRAREVGVRKSVGAQRGQLVTQFLFESALTSVIALMLALGATAVLRPVVNQLTGAQLTLAVWVDPLFWISCLVVFCVSTLVAGLYPAFVLSSFRPVAALKGKAGTFASRLWLRKGLVVVQFAASMVLVAGTVIVYNQLSYMRHLDLGIDLEQVLTVSGPRVLDEGVNREGAISTFTQEVRALPGVQQTATSAKLPGLGFNWYTSAWLATADRSSAISGTVARIDSSFADLYGLTLIAGEGFRNRSGSTPQGTPMRVIANALAVKALGFETPDEAVGQLIRLGGDETEIVGVFKDFSWSSAHNTRENMFFEQTQSGLLVSMKVNTASLPQTLTAIEDIYTTLFPGNPFRYTFADAQFEQQYRTDQQFATLFGLFASIAIVIACLGLFGLAAFTATRRTKEIGVRKVLGASVGGIIGLLSKDFLQLVGVAFVVAVPIAYFLMNRWLADFAYHIRIGLGVFLLTGALVLCIALATVSYQSIKAALADPVKSLRHE
ncbi:MAG TPA: ABC transporter permease [Rhodothermales bacterium]|nr:ABC transporter permease [Rhodothermales bacterium]